MQRKKCTEGVAVRLAGGILSSGQDEGKEKLDSHRCSNSELTLRSPSIYLSLPTQFIYIYITPSWS